MNKVVIDDRTDEQMETHTVLVVATDSFLSGWHALGGRKSYAAWACRPGEVEECERWVRSRSDMKRVRVVNANTYKPRGRGHYHIYVNEPERR